MEISDEIPTKKTKRLTSVVWNHFERVKKGDTCYAVCLHCNKKLSGSSNSGTTHLRNHLMRCLKRSNIDVTQLLSAKRKKDTSLSVLIANFDEGGRMDVIRSPMRVKLDQDQKDEGYQFAGIKLDEERSRLDLAYMVIVHGYPLSMVEHLGFNTYVKNLQPLWQPVPITDIEVLCINIYEKEKPRVIEMFQRLHGRVNVAVDMWIYPETDGYLCLTAHYIDNDWKLGKKILNFVTLGSYCTDDVLSEIITKCLSEWNLLHKLSAVTLHDLFLKDENVDQIKERLSPRNPLSCDSQLFDVHCAGRALSSIVEDAMEALQEVLMKIRRTIKQIKRSRASLDIFTDICQREGVNSECSLILDCPNQLKSTYYMLKIALEYRKALSCLPTQDLAITTAVSKQEWEWATFISDFLKFILEDSSIFSGKTCPTANMYFHEICEVHVQLLKWCSSEDALLSSMGLKMRHKFDKYWSKCSSVLAISAVLDPEFKLKLVEFYYNQFYGSHAVGKIYDVSVKLRKLFNAYTQSPSWSLSDQNSTLANSSLPSTCNNTRDRLKGFDKFVLETVHNVMPVAVVGQSRDRLKGFDKFLHETSQTQSMISELDKYLEEPLFPRDKDFNILNWWKVHAARYPILSVLARDILSIPMSTIAPELAFNCGGNVLDRSLATMKRTDVRQALICSRDWLQPELGVSTPFPIRSSVSSSVERG